MTSELKVLHVRSSVGMYGAERVLVNQSHRLKQQGVEVSVAVLTRSDDSAAAFISAVSALNVPVYQLVCKGGLDFSAFKLLLNVVRKGNPSVIHTHDYKSAIYVFLVMLFYRRAVRVATVHGWTRRTSRLKFYAVVERLLLSRYQGVVFVDRRMQQKFFPSRDARAIAVTIPNGVDCEGFAGVSERLPSRADGYDGQSVLFGVVGRLSVEKGCDLFIEAIARLHDCGRKARGVFIGDGPIRAELERLIQKHGLGDCVEFKGVKMDVAGELAEMDCFVMPSRTEGMPMALLEAMAAGVPVIATDVGSVAEVLCDGAGVVVRPESVDELVDAMTEFIDGKTIAAQMSAVAKSRVRREYSDIIQCRHTLEFYRSLLRG